MPLKWNPKMWLWHSTHFVSVSSCGVCGPRENRSEERFWCWKAQNWWIGSLTPPAHLRSEGRISWQSVSGVSHRTSPCYPSLQHTGLGPLWIRILPQGEEALLRVQYAACVVWLISKDLIILVSSPCIRWQLYLCCTCPRSSKGRPFIHVTVAMYNIFKPRIHGKSWSP